MRENVRLLCAADLHLGKKIRLPENFNDDFCVSSAFQELILFAIREKVDAILLAGDILESEEDFFEACHILEKTTNSLKEANIPIIAVTGNHDAALYRKLEKILDPSIFHILGKDEKWESIILQFHGREIEFQGFSFASSSLQYNPFDKYDLPRIEEGKIAIGILHCDLQDKKSIYGPASLIDFQSKSPKAWVLGHIHQSEILQDYPLIFYCGALMGMDVSECKEHGGFLLNIDSEGTITHETVCVAKLQWQQCVVHLDGVSEEDFEAILYKKILEAVDKSKITGIKLVLQGHCSFYDKLNIILPTLILKSDVFFIDRIVNLAEPDIDLERLARSNDIAAILARKLLALKQGQEDCLCSLSDEIMNMKLGHQYFKTHDLKKKSLEELKSLVLEAGYFVLNEMIKNVT